MDTIMAQPTLLEIQTNLALLQKHGIEPEVRLYLEAPPSSKELAEVIDKLGIGPWELLRREETTFKELSLGKDSASQAIIEAMCQHPTHRAPCGD